MLPKTGTIVNQNEIVNMEWSPNGFFMYFILQIASDSNFTDIVLEEQDLYRTYYDFECSPQSKYYWRLKTFSETETGYLESDWSDTAYFYSSEPNITISSPVGQEMWQYGLDYFIQWDDNIIEDVIIELYKENVLKIVIDSTESDGAYKWSIPIDTEIGCKYRIQIKSLDDNSLIGMSDDFFSVTDTNGNDGCSNSIYEQKVFGNILIYPNPVKDKVHVEFELKQNSDVIVSLLNVTGQAIKE